MPHRAPQKIRLPQTESAHDRCDPHDLFLVENDPVRFLQYRRKHRVRIFDRNAPVLAIDEILRHAAAERSWTIQRHHRNQIFETLRRELHQKTRETGRFRLENADRVPRAQHRARRLVPIRQRLHVKKYPVIFMNHVHRVVDDRQIAQPQKIHFEKPQLLIQILFVLRLEETVLRQLNRHIIIHRRRTNHHPRRVRP